MSNFWGAYQLIVVSVCTYFGEYVVLTFILTCPSLETSAEVCTDFAEVLSLGKAITILLAL